MGPPLDNRPTLKPHFAALQPPVPKPAPALLQPISTAGSGAAPEAMRSRASLVPVPRVPRVSMLSGGNLYQSFGLPGAAPTRRNVINEKPSEGEGDGSGTMGIGMTEKEIDERVISLVSILYSDADILPRSQRQLRPKSPGD